MKKQKKLIGIVRNQIEGAIFLYFEDGIFRLDCDLDQTSDNDAIYHYSKYGDVLERDTKIKNVIKNYKNLVK
jgi:hypothetical protein